MPQGLAGNGSKIGLGQAIAMRQQKGSGGNRPFAGNGGGGNGKQTPAPKKFNPMKVLKGLASSEVLSPEQLLAASRALSGLETKPEVHGYKRLATELGNEKDREAGGLETLGKRTTGQVKSVYQNIAGSAAQSLAGESALAGSLAGQSASIAGQGTQDLAKTQEGALGGLEQQLQMRGAEGTQGAAQSQLASAVAAQQASQQASSQASQQAAVQQGQGYSGLLAAEAQAAQNQGGETAGAINRAVGSRVAESDAKYDESIKTALQKSAEAKASRGEKTAKDYLGLREGDQKFILGKDAVIGNKEKLGLEEKQADAEAGENAIKLQNETRDSLASWQNSKTDKWKAEHPNAGENKAKEHEHELTHETNEVLSLLHNAVGSMNTFPSTSKELAELVVWVNGKASADPQTVSKVAKTWWNKHLDGLSKDTNGASLGH